MILGNVKWKVDTLFLLSSIILMRLNCFRFFNTDNTPPSFNDTCPDNMVFYATECSSSASLSWIEPRATDNSGQVAISYPAIRPPVNRTIGLYSVLYSATDSSGNRANCTFIVQVASKSLLLTKLVERNDQL